MQHSRYDAGDGRLGADILWSEVSFSICLVSAASSVTSDLSLEDLIQGLRDTSCMYLQEEREVLVEEWNPSSLALGWGTFEAHLMSQVTCENRLQLPSPRLAWNKTQTNFILCHVLFLLRPHWFSGRIFFFSLLASLGLLLSTSLFAAIRGYSVIAAHLF